MALLLAFIIDIQIIELHDDVILSIWFSLTNW